MIYPALQKGPYVFPGFHDPDDSRFIGIILRPNTWAAGTVYSYRDEDDADVVIPTTFKGFYYIVKNPGISNATTEPTWSKVINGETEDFETGETEGLIWKSVPYNLMPVSETISTVTYAQTNSVTLSNTSNTTTSLQFMIDPLPAAAIAAGSFEVTATVTKSNDETVDITLKFNVAEH